MSVAGAWAIDPGDPAYPEWLEVLAEDPMPTLHGLGDRACVAGLAHDAAVTIVGSRRPSPYGLRVAEELARDLAHAGVTVISGMAFGIDAAAHRGALAAGGPTIAVLAGGPDVVYPPRHRGLYRAIVASGAVLAEHPPGRRPERHSFPARNRIMAALAKLVVVVEAAEQSGSLITARRAIEQGREVGAVPGQIGSRVAAGANLLIRDGAGMITGTQDVLDRLAGVGARSVVRAGPELDPDLVRAMELVEAGASSPDALALAAGLEAQGAAVALARLELLGYVAADAAGSYCRTGLRPPKPPP